MTRSTAICVSIAKCSGFDFVDLFVVVSANEDSGTETECSGQCSFVSFVSLEFAENNPQESTQI